MEGAVPKESYSIPLGLANRLREGEDVTVVALGRMNQEAMAAADELAGKVNVEIIDPRSLVHLEEEAIIKSLEKTGRLVIVDEDYERSGFTAEVSALAGEKGFDHLISPIYRVATPNVPIPYNPSLEKHVLPCKENIINSIRKVMDQTRR
jgi:pyruvate dehydrogenase E1 component beta subunit